METRGSGFLAFGGCKNQLKMRKRLAGMEPPALGSNFLKP